jgi:hypothetical protein
MPINEVAAMAPEVLRNVLRDEGIAMVKSPEVLGNWGGSARETTR